MSELPLGWARATIADVTQTVDTVNPRANPEFEFTYVDISSIDNSVQVIAAPKVLQGAKAPSRARQLLRSGDTVFSTVRTYLRNIGYVDASLDGAVGSTGFAVLRPASGINGRYLYYNSLTNGFVDGLTAVMRGTSYPAVVDSQVREMPIAIAPTTEQERIVAVIEEQFSRLDAGVVALELVRKNLKRMRAAVLQAAVTGQLVTQRSVDEPAQSWLAAFGKELAEGIDESGVPPGWVRASIGSLKTWSLYGPRFTSDDYVPTGVPVLRTSDITPSGKILVDQAPKLALSKSELAKYQVCVGDILVTRTGSIGTVAFIADETPAIPGAYLILYRFGLPIEFAEYLFYCLQSPQIKHQLIGKSAGIGRPNLNAPSIDAIVVNVPPFAELQRILVAVKQALSVVDGLEAALDLEGVRSKRLRSAILATAFSGKLIPQDPTDEPAAVLLDRIATEHVSSNGSKTARARSHHRRMVST
jgi:type I restriction enzyme S subunit